jgi:hypothetical protein
VGVCFVLKQDNKNGDEGADGGVRISFEFEFRR